jgi:hypothetical protein
MYIRCSLRAVRSISLLPRRFGSRCVVLLSVWMGYVAYWTERLMVVLGLCVTIGL